MSATLSQQKFDVSNAGYQKCSRKRTYTEDEEQPHNTYKRIRTSFPSIIHNNLRQKQIASRSIDSWEDVTESRPRVVDLSTGEVLESVSSTKQKGRKQLERFPDVGENGEENLVTRGCIQNIQNLEKSAVNNEVKEENPRSTFDTIQDTPTRCNQFTKVVNTITETNGVIQTSRSLSMVVSSKNIKFEFAEQCQQALDKYLRSQIDYVDDGACGIYGKEMVLYRPDQDDSGSSPKIREITDEGDIIEGKIVEVNEDDIVMCDIEVDTSEPIMEIEKFSDQGVDENDKMDID